jgi:hypothetical protein
MLKYFNLGTIDNIEIKRYERSKKKKLNVILAILIGGENIHYNVLYTEEKIVYNKALNGKQSRTSTIKEKINFINKSLKEFEQYYDNNAENIIITTYDDDISKISSKVTSVKFDIVDKDVFSSIIKDNKIDEDIFYSSVMKARKKDFVSVVEVRDKLKKLLHLEQKE